MQRAESCSLVWPWVVSSVSLKPLDPPAHSAQMCVCGPDPPGALSECALTPAAEVVSNLLWEEGVPTKPSLWTDSQSQFRRGLW